MPQAGFELAIPASERPQIHALDCAATGTGCISIFLARSQNCEKRLLASCLTVRMGQLDSHITDFHELRCLMIFREFFLK